jgi:hypothetical protein
VPVDGRRRQIRQDARLSANSGLPAAERFMGKMTHVADLPATADLKSWLKEAMELNEAGTNLPMRETKTPRASLTRYPSYRKNPFHFGVRRLECRTTR